MNILDTLNKIVREYSKKDITLEVSTNFDGLGFDSLDKVEVLMQLEETFDITFPDDLQVSTVGDLVGEIEKLVA